MFFREQLKPFAIHSDLSELEREDISFFDILTNNIIVCTFAMLGVYLFRIPALLVYIVNPVVLGFILAANWVSTGEIFYFVNMLIPHSIFEIPAIVMACSFGIKGKQGREDLKEDFFKIYMI